MKTLVKMKSTEMGKDDDTAITIKYPEGCECRIGPDLLKAFQDKDAVEILSEKTSPKKADKAEEKDSDVEDGPEDEKSDTNGENEKAKEAQKKPKKKSK